MERPWREGLKVPQKPTPRGYSESFSSKLGEFLNEEIFYSLKEAHLLAERWRVPLPKRPS